MSSDVLGFQDIDKTKIGIVGGKGANLGELSIQIIRHYLGNGDCDRAHLS